MNTTVFKGGRRMTVRYRCRHCKAVLGTLPIETEEAIQKLHQFEVGEIEEFIERQPNGETTVHCICEQCEASMRQFPNYYALKNWLQ